MQYVPPLGSSDPDAQYTDPVDGTIPSAAVEQPMREIASVVTGMGLVPSQTDMTQLDQAIDLKVAAMQPDLSAFVSRDALRAQREELVRYVDSAIASEKYNLCEFYYFRNPALKPGFRPAEGALLENAAALYPDAWAFLQTEQGRALCISGEEWQAMNRAVWATLADGAQVGWNGIGGVPFYAPDWETGSLRLPDLRGMYAEASGLDNLGVGDVHGDAIRNITGAFTTNALYTFTNAQGAVTTGGSNIYKAPLVADETNTDHALVAINASRVVPTAARNQPRAWGAQACVYLGLPGA